MDVFNDSIAWRRIFLYLILLVVVPTILLTLYGVAAINNLRVAVEADLERRYEEQSRVVEARLLREVAATEERLASAVRGVPSEDLDAVMADEAMGHALVAEAWIVRPAEAPPSHRVADVIDKAQGMTDSLVSIDVGREVEVYGIVSGGEDRWVVWRLDPDAIKDTVLPAIVEEVAFETDEPPAAYRIRTTRPSVSMTVSIQETVRSITEDPLVDRPLTPPLDRWHLTAMSTPDFVASKIANTTLFYIVGMVLLVCAVITGVFLSGRALMREMRLSQLQTDFVSNVSHELRTPLTSIRMFIETLQSGRVRDPARTQECLDVVAAETERLSRMIERILGWARMEAGRRLYSFESVAPELLVEQALEAFRTQQLHEEPADVDVELPGNLRPVRADVDAVTEALLNLLNNAWKYTGPEKRIGIRTIEDRTGVGIEVSDNGPGIPRHERTRIFDKFYRPDVLLTRKTQGSGLGLAIVRAVAEAHQGRVELDSEEGRGSRFTLWLRYA